MSDMIRLFCLPIAEAVHPILKEKGDALQEVRIRAGRPLAVRIGGQCRFVSERGQLLQTEKGALRVDWDMVLRCLELISGSSLYAFEHEMQNGFITVEGGHRVGMTGRAVVKNGRIEGINPVTGLCVRIAHECRGCAEKLFPHVTQGRSLLHTLIISPPGGGKTTMLRDLIRLSSDELHLTVAVADERSEMAGSFRGVPQCDVGRLTDVLDGCPKGEGMMMLLRAMSPQVIAADELGGPGELEAVETILNAGVRLLCSAHSSDLEELAKRPGFDELLRRGVFDRIAVLSGREGPGTLEAVYHKTEDGRYAVG